ncbi:MAG: hypothetical protein WCS80_03165 [Bacilli bacterium]
MSKISTYLKGKSVGFYFILGSLVLSLVALIIFFSGLGGDGFISWVSFACLFLIVIGDCILIYFKKESFAPALNSVLGGISLILLINDSYLYVSTVMTGIDIESFSAIWISSVIVLVLLFGISIASIFIPLTKKNNTNKEETIHE